MGINQDGGGGLPPPLSDATQREILEELRLLNRELQRISKNVAEALDIDRD